MHPRVPHSRLSLTLALALLLASCAKRESPVEAGLRTHTLLVGNRAEPSDLDPQLSVGDTTDKITFALFEGLTALDEKTSQPVPAAAERWDVSDDGLTYTFHLRADGRWSNGDRVTAADFAFSFRRILTPALGAQIAYMLRPIKNAEAFNSGKITDFNAVGVTVLDDATLRLTLGEPTPYLPALASRAAWFPVHRATIEKFGRFDQRGSRWTRPGNLVGNGAFTLAEWSANSRIVVVKNPGYRDAAHNALERVVFFPTDDIDGEERSFRAGQLHVTSQIPPTKIAGYLANDAARLRLDPSLSNFFLRFNVTRPPLDNPKVRRALSLAIDREAIIRTVMHEAARPAPHFTPPDCGGYTARARVPTDFAAARRLLAEAGFPGGRNLPALEVALTGKNASTAALLEIFQATCQRELGVRILLAPVEEKTLWQNEQTLNYTISSDGWLADFTDPSNFLEIFLRNGPFNQTGWGHPDYDRLLGEAARARDPVARFEIFQKAEALLLEEAPVAPIYFTTSAYLIHLAVKNWESSALNYHRYQLVRLEAPR